MAGEDENRQWNVSRRRLANVAGLDAEAEWLLGVRGERGEGRDLYLAKSLTARYEYRNYPLRREPVDPIALAEGVGGHNRPHFSIVISPEPRGENGEEILDVLQSVAEEAFAADKERDERRKPFFLMSQTDRTILKNNRVAGAICNAAFFDAAIGDARFRRIPKVVRLSSALRERAVPDTQRTTWSAPDWLQETLRKVLQTSPKTGPGPVVVGVIDDSFAIGHPRFQFSNGQSRIFSYWDQDADYDYAHATVPFGRELLSVNPGDFDSAWPNKESLNGFLAQATAQNLPLPEFYGLPGLRPFFPPRPTEKTRIASHGTHVLDLAAGANRRDIKGFPPEQAADAAPALLAVKLPRASVQDTSGAFLEFYMLEGVRHIISRAKMLHPDAKVVIVSSYGFYGGPHDGASQIERDMDALIAAAHNDVEIVLPSGNGRRERTHTLRDFDQREVQEISWRVAPDDDTPSVMEVWSEPYPQGAGAMMELSVVTPDGLDSRATGDVLTDVQTAQQLVLVENGRFIIQAVCVHPDMHPGRRLFLIWMQPTALNGPGVVDTPAASGVWTVRMRALDAVYTRPASVWIRRDDSLVGFASGGRQSSIERDWTIWKDDPNDNQQLREEAGNAGTAQRSRTINKIATCSRTVVVGGFEFDRADRFPVPSSAGGPTAPRPDSAWPDREGPDALAPSQIFGGFGIAAAGFFGGGKVRFRGTSVAAPLVGAEIASAITDSGFPGGREFVHGEAAASEASQPSVSRPSRALGGYGRYVTARMRHRGMPFEDT